MRNETVSQAIERWLAAPFPVADGPGDADDDVYLADLKGDLAYWDALVADAVIPWFRDGRSLCRGGAVDIGQGLADFKAKLETYVEEANSAHRPKLEEYRTYCGLLYDVWVAVEQSACGSPNQPCG